MIFCIIGKSATGKDSVFSKLISMDKNLQKILIYTTRPKRDNESINVEYNFVDKKFLEDNENKIIEKRVYNTVYGEWIYATLDDGSILDNKNYIIIATLESYNKLKKYFGKDKVYPIYLELPNKLRYERAKQREEQQKVPKYEEMERRFKADEIDFSEDNIKNAGIIKRYTNIDLEKCVDEIYRDIENHKC